MKYCSNCGKQLEDDVVYCIFCGHKQETVESSKSQVAEDPQPQPQVNIQSIKESILACDRAQELYVLPEVYPVINQNKELQGFYAKRLEFIINEEQKRAMQIAKANSQELWSWIHVGGEKTLYENTGSKYLTKEIFMQSVKKKLKENGVPAEITQKKIYWDCGKEMTEEYTVEVRDPSLRNPFSMIIKYIQVGAFTFIGNNMFITPPDLPPYPRDQVEVPTTNGMTMIIIGAIITLLGLGTLENIMLQELGLVALLAGIGLLIAGGMIEMDKKSKIASNELRRKEIHAWNAAWDGWIENQVEYVFQQVVSGKLECIREAVIKSVQQVCQEKFEKKPVLEEKKAINQSELESIIAKKRKAIQ